MSQYKKPKTRIKAVTGKGGVTRYYAEYYLGFFWGWQFTRPGITSSDYALALEDAQSRIDDFLRRDLHRWASEMERKGRKTVVKYITYPEDQ